MTEAMFPGLAELLADADQWIEDYSLGRRYRTLPIPRPQSSLGEDDRRLDPWEASHIVAGLWGTGIEHMHAVGVVMRAGHAPPGALSTLIRSAIECGAAALWLLQPPNREVRLTRSLRLWWTDYEDLERYQESTKVDIDSRTSPRRMHAIAERATELGLDAAEVRRRIRTTQIVAEAGDDADGSPILPLWQMASGFAHGRVWSRMSGSTPEAAEWISKDDLRVAFTIDAEAMVKAFAAGMYLLKRTAEVATVRGQ